MASPQKTQHSSSLALLGWLLGSSLLVVMKTFLVCLPLTKKMVLIYDNGNDSAARPFLPKPFLPPFKVPHSCAKAHESEAASSAVKNRLSVLPLPLA